MPFPSSTAKDVTQETPHEVRIPADPYFATGHPLKRISRGSWETWKIQPQIMRELCPERS